MGGAQAGEVASKAAADAFDRELPAGAAGAGPAGDDRGGQPDDPRARPQLTRTWPGWGRRSPRRSSTSRAEEVAIGHVGDSRAYRLRGGKLERLTRDHSLVEEMRRKGQLTEAQAEDHPQRSIITRALGPGTGGRGRPADGPRPGRRRLPALLRRADDDARRRAHRPPARARDLDAGGGPGPGRRSQPGRRPRQHHRRRLPPSTTPTPRRAAPEGRDADRPHRRGGRPDRDRGAPPGRRRGGPQAARGAATSASRAAACAPRPRCWPCWSLSPRSPSAPGTATARSGSSAPTRPAASRSTAACPTSCRSGSSSTTSAIASPIQTEALPPKRRDAVTGHDLRSREDAVSLIEEIQNEPGGSVELAPGTASWSLWFPSRCC